MISRSRSLVFKAGGLRAVRVLAMTALTLAGCESDFPSRPDSRGATHIDISPTTSTADGTSIVTLTVTVDPLTLSKDTKVVLTTSIGVFLGGTTTITIAANDTGVALAQLRAPTTAGTAVVSVTFGGVTKYVDVLFSAAATPATKGVTRIEFVSPSAPADGASLVTVRLHVDTLPRPASNSVLLSTTAGALVGGTPTLTVPVNDSGFAYARIRAPNDSNVSIVSATAGGITKYAEFVFVAAPPDAAQLTSSAFELKAGSANTINVTTVLSRLVGTPSPGVTITFSADSAGGGTGDFGQFSPRSVLSASNSVSTRFTSGVSPFRGVAMLRVRATRGAVTVTDSTSVLIVP